MDSRLKRAAIRGALIGVAFASMLATAATFNLFQPATGILVGSSSTYVTTAAAAGNITALWSGSCGPTTYLSGSGVCSTPAGTGGGTVNSVALTMPSGFSVGGSPVTSTGTLAVTTTLSGVLKGTGSGFTTGAAADIVALFSTCSGTQYLGADGACHTSGTVSSVALADGSTSPIFTISGSPVTGSGTLTETLSTQAANLVLAGPTTGSAAQPTFRALVAADIPLISLSSGVTGSLPFANLTITSANVIGLWTGTCNSSSYLNGAGVCTVPSGAGTVTSVGLSAPSVFAVGGTNPVTGSGTIALTFATGQTANSFLATPNGTTGAVGLRTIVAGDLPGSITSNTSGNAATATALASAPTQCTTNYAIGIAVSGNAICSSAIAPTMTGNWIFTPGSGTALTVNSAASNVAAAFVGVTGVQVQTWNSTTGAANAIGLGWGVGISGGAWNFFTQSTDPLIIGTNGAASLTLATNGSGRIAASSAGNITIAAPSSSTSLVVSGLSANNTIVANSTGAAAGLGIGWAAGISGGAWNIWTQSTDPLTVGTQGNALLCLAADNVCRETIAGGGSVTIGSPTGGGQGAGTINAIGLYVNGIPVAGGLQESAYGRFTGSCPGSALHNMTCTSYTSGVAILNISTGSFATVPNCIVQTIFNSSTASTSGYVDYTSSSSTALAVDTFSAAGTPTNTTFFIQCLE